MNRLIETVDVITEGNSVIIKMRLISRRTAYEIIESENTNELRINFFRREESDWYEKESEHFSILVSGPETGETQTAQNGIAND